MKSSEKMAKRAVLFGRLTIVDRELTLAFGRTPSNRNTAVARGLLNNRATICDALIAVGYEPWDVPTDIEETKVSHG